MTLAGRRILIEWLAVGLVTSAVVAWLAWGSAIQRPNNLVYDGLMRLRGGQPSEQIVIVAIDNRSIAALGRWPWPRRLHGQLIDRLHAAGARAVAYDVLFTEPSAAGDDDLAQALTRAGNVHLPLMIDPVGDNGAPWQVVPPIPILGRAAAGVGHVNLTADGDGVVRRLPLWLAAGDRVWPHMIVRLFEPGRAGPAPSGSARLTGLGSVPLSYRGPPGQFRTVSFVDLVRGETPPQFLAGRYVLVGMTADGLGDRYATPASRAGELTPGVEVQASLLDTLIAGDALRPLAGLGLALLSLAPVWMLMAGFLLLRPALNMALGAGLILAVFAVSAAAFFAGLWIAPLAAVAGLALAYPLWSWRRLAAASAYMQTEIEAFETVGPGLPKVRGGAGDVVSRQIETLRAALAAFRTAVRQREEALQLLSHDMRAPQVSILTLLQSRQDRADPEFERRIAGSARLTLALAESYVQLARAESRRLATSRFDLSQALLDAADILWPQAEARGVRIVTPAEPSELLVDGDQAMLTRALMNLIDNAIKYGPAGGEVDCIVGAEGASGACTIRDRGQGLPAELLDHLYEPFRRGPGDRTGAGLGLAFVRTVAERHGGSIAYEGGEDGAVFVLRLPLADER
ncbi:MAG TPA: CHASE2 domain-containing protein [Caulobacter sp.]|nr:CHASE2 domain-containing protein [Caulobacter sp.]